MGGDGGNAAGLLDDKIAVFVDFDPQRMGQ